MAVNFERFGMFLGEDLQVSIFFQGTSEVDQIAIRLGCERSIRQPRAD